MRRLSKERHVYSFSAQHTPAYEVSLGEPFVVETWDAFAGRYTEADGGRSAEGKANPATGPICVQGVEPGEAVAIEILSIQPVGTGILRTREAVLKIPMEGGFAVLGGVPWRLEPMVGVLGVAPARGAYDCKVPGPCGGNLDTSDVCAGAVLHLVAQVPGALLAMGDVHALMGEGESNGMGIEVGADITVRVRVERQPLTMFPYILLEDRLVVVASAETLDEACRMSVLETRRIVEGHLGVGAEEARLLVGVLGNVRVSQIVNPLVTARVDFPLAREGTGWVLRSTPAIGRGQ